MRYRPTDEQIEARLNNFKYHAPTDDQVDRMIVLRDQAMALSQLQDEYCPLSRELSLAKTKLEEAVFWANAAIVRNENNDIDAQVTGTPPDQASQE